MAFLIFIGSFLIFAGEKEIKRHPKDEMWCKEFAFLHVSASSVSKCQSWVVLLNSTLYLLLIHSISLSHSLNQPHTHSNTTTHTLTQAHCHPLSIHLFHSEIFSLIHVHVALNFNLNLKKTHFGRKNKNEGGGGQHSTEVGFTLLTQQPRVQFSAFKWILRI